MGLQRFDSIFGRKFAHDQRQLAIGCHVDGSRINSLNVFRGAGTASIHFHNKFDVLHILISLMEQFSGTNEAAVHFFEVEYTTAVKGLPHSKQRAGSHCVLSEEY